LERALEIGGYVNNAQILWRPFQLNPTMPKSGMDRRAYLDAKFGGAAARQGIEKRLAEVGEVDGIDFVFDRIERTPNTFDAHRLIWFAQHQHKQNDVAEALFHAYFTEGRNVGDEGTLVEVATGAGLVSEDVRRYLASREGIEEVRSEEAAGHRLGIRGVPYFLVNHIHAISGAQPPDVFVSAMRESERDLVERRAGS
jgi:predicted DsbA family dithiol-disulfide isomerase